MFGPHMFRRAPTAPSHPAGNGAAPRRAPGRVIGIGADQGHPAGSTRGQPPRTVHEPAGTAGGAAANGAGPAPGHPSTVLPVQRRTPRPGVSRAPPGLPTGKGSPDMGSGPDSHPVRMIRPPP